MFRQSAIPPRLFFLDWLRILAFALLVVYHTGMLYVRWDYHVKSAFAGPALEPWMKLSQPWRMSLIFMIAGAATACMLRAGPSVALARRRSAFLLLPLLCGVVLIVPPQSYVEVVQKFGYSGSYVEFLGPYFTHYRGFCSAERCLILPTWNHLWFLPYLWVYTMLLFGVLTLWPAALRDAARIAEATLDRGSLILVPVLLLFTARVALFDRYPETHALIDDGFVHVEYLGMFVMGAVFVTAQSMWARMASLRWFGLAIALGSWVVLVLMRPGGVLAHGVVAAFQWSALVAVFGFGWVHLNRDSPFRSQLNEAVFPVYVLHQTIIVLGSHLLRPLQLRPLVEAPILIAATFVLAYSGYALIRRRARLRRWFGLRKALPV